MVVTEEVFYKIIQDTWTSTMGFLVDRPSQIEFPSCSTFTVCVKISGAWDGEVRLHCSPPLARLIASAIFQIDANQAGNEEILDALSELIHIVGGNLKALLPQPVNLSLPSLPDPTNWAQTTPQWQLICKLVLATEGYPFVVTLLGSPPATPNVEISAHCKTRSREEKL
ncbi:MAG TPA: chemotaxis protein CheX [Terriglobia bacterium]|nr:chemotaxis protein CheX [Terriglobia bacterium]